jgi:hypothetical protein
VWEHTLEILLELFMQFPFLLKKNQMRVKRILRPEVHKLVSVFEKCLVGRSCMISSLIAMDKGEQQQQHLCGTEQKIVGPPGQIPKR